jgi:hypothetical protein
MKRLALMMPALIVLLSASGCVFLRLLELKHQLADFDENFSVDTEDGITVRFLNPVILERDMWLLGLPPSVKDVYPTHTTWIHIFEKQYASGHREDINFDLSVSSRFEHSKLTEFGISESYFVFIPKEAVLLTIRSLGKVDIDVGSRKASLEVTDDDSIEDFAAPNRQNIVNTLGIPFVQSEGSETHSLEYRYMLLPPSTKANPENPPKDQPVYRLRFFFDQKDEISMITGRLPFVGDIKFSYD